VPTQGLINLGKFAKLPDFQGTLMQKAAAKSGTPQEALETAYWMHWCGDTEYSRKLLIRIANFVLNKEPSNGSGKQKIPVNKQSKVAFDENGEKYFIG
jgi:hypothetical protein